MNVRSLLHLLLSWHAVNTTMTTASRLDGGRGIPGEESAPDIGNSSGDGTTEDTDGGRSVHIPERKLSTRSCKGGKGKKGGCVEPAFCKNRTTFEGHIYVHMPKGITWPDANAQVKTLPRCCGDKEAHLVSLSSKEETNVVYNMAPRGLPWTALYFNFLTNEFEWVDGTPYIGNASNWVFDEEPPRPIRDPCGYLSVTLWDLARCDDTTSGYVAEYDCE